ncbi:MAG TPA: hypothetical protein PK217_11860, partial [Sphingopyxis terrae]|nr:hypothetical protein [Sphingopyxis terrae]
MPDNMVMPARALPAHAAISIVLMTSALLVLPSALRRHDRMVAEQNGRANPPADQLSIASGRSMVAAKPSLSR